MAITIKSRSELDTLREAGRIVGSTLEQIRAMVRPGLNLLDVEAFVREEFKRRGALETFLHYQPAQHVPPFPSNICISVNDELVHGIPSDRELVEGDVVTFDLGATYKGYVGDSAFTVVVGGDGPPEVQALLHCGEEALNAGIAAAGNGGHLNDICGAIEDVIRAGGYGLVEGYGGHGVGRSMHEEPHVANHRGRFRGPKLQPGLVLALEPMLNMGDKDVYVADDNWTVRTRDGSLCCHFEHTIAIRDGFEVEILTLP
jgi:methionyl aminopeptidase